jgi:hypothetical protein
MTEPTPDVQNDPSTPPEQLNPIELVESDESGEPPPGPIEDGSDGEDPTAEPVPQHGD